MVHQTYSDRHVCIMGLGYVGLTLAVAMAEAGFEVLGVERRKDAVDKLNRGEPHFFETGLEPPYLVALGTACVEVPATAFPGACRRLQWLLNRIH